MPSARASTRDEGISYTEFSYQILQGLDFLELYRSTAACCRPAAATSGATSPAAPISSTAPRARAVHAIGTPLITNSDGTKFGKSEGNAIWLDAALTQPVRVLPVLAQHRRRRRHRAAQGLHLPHPRRDRASSSRSWRPSRSGARRSARSRARSPRSVHGAAATERAIAASEALFGQGDLAALDAATLAAAIAELPHAARRRRRPVAQLLVDTGLTASLGEARRAIAQGGVYAEQREGRATRRRSSAGGARRRASPFCVAARRPSRA